MKRLYIYLSLIILVLSFSPKVYASTTLWQIGQFDGNTDPITGSGEYPLGDVFHPTFDYDVTEATDPTPNFPGYISDNKLSYYINDGRPFIVGADVVDINFSIDCYLNEVVLVFDRYGSETDEIFIDGNSLGTVYATEGGFKHFSIDVGDLIPGDHTITIDYQGGASDNGHYVDALRLDYESSVCDKDEDGYYEDEDCDDDDAAINPGAEEICDGLDNDCDKDVDEDLIAPEADKQYGVCEGSTKVCDGTSGWVEPDYALFEGYEEEELTCDTIDNDCDGTTDQHVCPWYCIPTVNDDTEISATNLGVNRHAWYGEDRFTTMLPKGKSKVENPSQYSLADTNGCSCTDILNQLSEYNSVAYGEMEGHWKYGCSKSVMDDFIEHIIPNIGSLTGTWLLSVNGGSYKHDMYLTQTPNGDLEGTGGYPTGSGPDYPFPYKWTLIGSLSHDAVTMTIDYENSYSATISGSVDSLWNSMSGGAGTGGVTNWTATRQ